MLTLRLQGSHRGWRRPRRKAEPTMAVLEETCGNFAKIFQV
jgi:hypothetical protein